MQDASRIVLEDNEDGEEGPRLYLRIKVAVTKRKRHVPEIGERTICEECNIRFWLER
jgi:hypothetical protein